VPQSQPKLYIKGTFRILLLTAYFSRYRTLPYSKTSVVTEEFVKKEFQVRYGRLCWL